MHEIPNVLTIDLLKEKAEHYARDLHKYVPMGVLVDYEVFESTRLDPGNITVAICVPAVHGRPKRHAKPTSSEGLSFGELAIVTFACAIALVLHPFKRLFKESSK